MKYTPAKLPAITTPHRVSKNCASVIF